MKGQIIKIISNDYFVSYQNKEYICKARGKLRNKNLTLKVGDYCIFNEKEQVIEEICKRRNSLERPSVSNIDQAFIVTSCKSPDFSANLLDKLLVVLEFNNIKPVICFTKRDLLTKSELKEIKQVKKYYQSIGYTTLWNTNLFRIKRLFKNKTTVFTGQTGAGKSSLLNKIAPKLKLETGEISKALGRGKHTTRHVELIELYHGKVLDTPGFSSIDFSDMDNLDIRNSFIEFPKYNCPYHDCMHTKEKDCLVKQAAQTNKMLAERLTNYQKFINRK